jgi:hypothetical protein
LYKDLPIISAKKPSLKITLNKAVQLINARGTISGVQKKGQKKRKADEMEAIGLGTAIASGLRAPGAPIVRSTRAAIARGKASLARGQGGAHARRGRTS